MRNTWVSQEEETSYYSMWVCQNNLIKEEILTKFREVFGIQKAKRGKVPNIS